MSTPRDVAALHRELGAARDRLRDGDSAVFENQLDIVRIPAPTGSEGARADWVRRRFLALGLRDVAIDAAGNVAGRRDGTASLPPVVVCAHLDTVFPEGTDVIPRREGARWIAPGISDNARGLAAMLAVAGAVDGDSLRTRHPIDFVGTTGEEGLGDLRGAKEYFATRGRGATAAVILDGGGDQRVVHGALASRRFRVTIRGPGGHSWSSHGVANPNHAVAAAAAAIARIPLPTTPRTTLSVNRMAGGFAVNSLPELAWIEIDLRSHSADMIEACSLEIARAARAATDDENARRAPGTPDLAMTIERIGDRPGGATPVDHPLVVAALEATAIVGRTPDAAVASTDANIPISLGIPAVAIGGGGACGDTHTLGEWFDNTDGARGIARALTVVVAAAS